jgi:hypothetical protein
LVPSRVANNSDGGQRRRELSRRRRGRNLAGRFPRRHIAFTNELARTIAAPGAHVDAAVPADALHAEAMAYEKQLQQTISPATLCALQSSLCKK